MFQTRCVVLTFLMLIIASESFLIHKLPLIISPTHQVNAVRKVPSKVVSAKAEQKAEEPAINHSPPKPTSAETRLQFVLNMLEFLQKTNPELIPLLIDFVVKNPEIVQTFLGGKGLTEIIEASG